MQTLLETVKMFLLEMPTVIDVRKNDPYMLMKQKAIDLDKHLESTPIDETSEHRISKIDTDSRAYQYAKIRKGENVPVFRIDAEKLTHFIPNKTGSKVVSMIKFNTSHQYPDVKKVYDHLLNSHDYIKTNDIQYPGGKHTWLNLVNQYELSGKNLYIHENGNLRSTTANEIHQQQGAIWDSTHTHILISNKKLL